MSEIQAGEVIQEVLSATSGSLISLSWRGRDSSYLALLLRELNNILKYLAQFQKHSMNFSYPQMKAVFNKLEHFLLFQWPKDIIKLLWMGTWDVKCSALPRIVRTKNSSTTNCHSLLFEIHQEKLKTYSFLMTMNYIMWMKISYIPLA